MVVHHTELPGCHAMYLVSRVYHVAAIGQRLQGGMVILRRVAYLERHIGLRGIEARREKMKIVYLEIFFVSRFRVISMAYIEYILPYIFLNDKPGATA